MLTYLTACRSFRRVARAHVLGPCMLQSLGEQENGDLGDSTEGGGVGALKPFTGVSAQNTYTALVSGISWTALTHAAGSWQIADRALRHGHGELSCPRGVAVSDFRVRFVVEP
jgi:hypothetical protein